MVNRELLLILILVVPWIPCCVTKVIEIPSNEMTYDKKDYTCIPDNYVVISKSKYDSMVRREIECKEILLEMR